MRIFVVGGTGFLGYHTILELLRKKHTVTLLSLPPLPAKNLFPAQVKIILADLHSLHTDEKHSILRGHDAAIFAAGADDRVIPKAPAYAYFHRENVETVNDFIRIAASAGLTRLVIFGSYMAHFDRIWPEKRLADRHPYIRSRAAQEAGAFHMAGDKIDVMVLELPFIFGSMPGRRPLWAPLIRYIASPAPLFAIEGGTNMIAVTRVAEAAAGALMRGKGGCTYLIGDQNLSWVDWLKTLSRLTGRERSPHLVKRALLQPILHMTCAFHRIRGREPGLNPAHILDFLAAESFFDPSESRDLLGYRSGGLETAFSDTVQACLPK
jgi:nucleoside-diphosphate-sugar epimerase